MGNSTSKQKKHRNNHENGTNQACFNKLKKKASEEENVDFVQRIPSRNSTSEIEVDDKNKTIEVSIDVENSTSSKDVEDSLGSNNIEDSLSSKDIAIMVDNCFCDTLQIQNFKCIEGPKLEEKLKPVDGADMFGKIKKELLCHLGNGENEKMLPILEIVEILLERNYPEIMELNGKSKLAIFVPEWYLTKLQALKYVDTSRGSFLRSVSEESSKKWPLRKKFFDDNKKKIIGARRAYSGDLPEKRVYEVLQKHFMNSDKIVAVFNGLEILKLNLDNTFKLSEKDFIIINATHKYIMVIEVKKSLGPGNSLLKSIKQIIEAKEDLEAWFATEGLHHWRFVPLIVTEEIKVVLDCDGCKDYFIEGVENVDVKLNAVEELHQKPIDAITIEEFKTIFKYLTFVACAAKAPFRQKMLDETLNQIKKVGSAENIQRWCWWTPSQLSLMQQADKLDRVILIGGNGTGKTAMLDEFVRKTAIEFKEEKVLFAIQQYFPSSRPLLQLELKLKYEKFENVTIASFHQFEDIQWNNYSSIAIDEVNFYDIRTKDIQEIQAKNLWVVIRHTFKDNPEEYLRGRFPNPWTFVHLKYPLRTPKILSEKVKGSEVKNNLHHNDTNRNLHMTENMPLGPKPIIIQRKEGSYYERLKLAFSKVNFDRPALIILDWSDMKPSSKEIQDAKTKTPHQKLTKTKDKQTQHYLVAIEALKDCKRPHHPPLQWFSSRYASISNSEDNIKEWMIGRNKKDLITDSECVAGYEADFIILLGSKNVEAYMSRCRGQFVHIDEHPSLVHRISESSNCSGASL